VSVSRLWRYVLWLHGFKINERIEYKLLALTYKVLTNRKPDYLHNLISVQSSGRTRSSSTVTLARPSVSSSLQVTNRSFTYASPYLWNQLPSSFRQPHCIQVCNTVPEDRQRRRERGGRRGEKERRKGSKRRMAHQHLVSQNATHFFI